MKESKNVIELGNIVSTGNWNSPQRGRIYYALGLCPTIATMGGGGRSQRL